ncbi:MAG: N-glycosylase/DNA lyase [Nitrospirota bacterium]
MEINDLLRHYKSRKEEIRARLAEFKETWRQGDIAVFKELCFCILTANTSARMGITCIEAAGDNILTADAEGIRNILCGRYRFWKTRPEYIVHTREYLKREGALSVAPLTPAPHPVGEGNLLKAKIVSLSDFQERRDFFADNPGVKGLGYKEASHFLRNIGFEGYAILDIHVIRLLHELGVLPEAKRPANKKQYIFMEERMREFSMDIKIGMDELDLALWSYRTGEILK